MPVRAAPGAVTRTGTLSGVGSTSGVGSAVSSVAVRGVPPAVAALAAVAGVLVTLTGCSAVKRFLDVRRGVAAARSAPRVRHGAGRRHGAASPGPATAPAALPTASMTPLAAASGQLTGTQLESVLLPQSDFPAGFATPRDRADQLGRVADLGHGHLQPGDDLLRDVHPAPGHRRVRRDRDGVGQRRPLRARRTTSWSTSSPRRRRRRRSFPACRRWPAGAGRSRRRPTARPARSRCGRRAGAAVGGHPTVELLQTGTLGSSKLVLDTLFCASGVDVFAASGVGVGGAAAPDRADQGEHRLQPDEAPGGGRGPRLSLARGATGPAAAPSAAVPDSRGPSARRRFVRTRQRIGCADALHADPHAASASGASAWARAARFAAARSPTAGGGRQELGQVGAVDAGQLVELGAAGEAVGQDRSAPLAPAVRRLRRPRPRCAPPRTAGSSAVSATATETS